MKERYTSNNIAVNEDGKTKLYELCSLTFLESESASKEVLDLIDSYPEEIRATIINKKVEIPQRVKRLMDHARISLEGYNIGDTPLHVSIRNEATLVIKKLIESGANVNQRNKHGTPLEEAVNIINPKIVEILLKAGAKVDIFESPLFLANDIEKTDPNDKDIKKIIKLLKAAQKAEIREKTPSIAQEAISAIKNIFSFNSKSPTSIDLKKTKTKPLSSLDDIESFTDTSTAPPSPIHFAESISSTMSYGKNHLEDEAHNQDRRSGKKAPPPMPNSEEISKYREEQIQAMRAESATPPANFSNLARLDTSISSYGSSLESAGLIAEKNKDRNPPIIMPKAKNKETQR